MLHVSVAMLRQARADNHWTQMILRFVERINCDSQYDNMRRIVCNLNFSVAEFICDSFCR